MSSDNVSIVEISAGTNKIVEVADATGKIVEVQTQGPKGPNFDPSLSQAYTNPANNDLLPIYDVANGVAKKITLEDLIASRARDSRRIYLSKDARASDSNNGTSQEEPLLTFEAAIALAEAGDVIEVSPGTYVEASLPLRVPRDVGIFAKSLRQVKIQPASGQEMNGFFKVDSGFWVWGLEFAGHQADLANNQQSWAVSFDEQADNTAAPLNASGLGAFILKSPYIQNCSSITAEDDAGTAGSVSVGDTGGGIEVDGDKCAPNSPIRSMVVDSYTQVNLGGPGCHVRRDGYAQLVSFFGTFCTFHVKADTGGQANLSGGGTTDFGDQGLVADGYSHLPNFSGAARIASYGADRAESVVTIDVSTDTFTTASAHPLVVNDQITLNATDGTLPTGLAAGTTYFVISSGLTSNNFKVSLTEGGSSVDITGAASGTYQFVRQGQLTADVVSLTSNRIGSKSRPNPGQLMFPHATFPSAGEPGSAGNAVSVTAGTGAKFTVTLNSFSYGHEYVAGGTVTVGGTSYNVSSAVYDNSTGIVTLSATGYTPVTGDSAVLADLQFICPIQGAYTITGSVPIDASGNVVANDSPSLAGYRLNFYNTVNGGLRTPLAAGQPLDFRLRSQISCALHTMEFVGAGTNYNALPWNGGVPIPANQRVELNNGRVFGATINEKGDFEIGDGTFSIDGTTGEATINTSQFNLSGLNFVGPFSRNGGFSTVGVQLKEVSANTSLISSTGAADGNTAPTQSAVKAYVDSTTVQSVDLSAPTGFTSSGGPITGSGTLDLAFDTGYQGYLTAESTKLAGIEAGATADQTDAEIKVAYENNANTNAFTDAEQSKLSGIESGATADQTDAEIKTAYENNANTNAFTDAEQSKLSGIEANATQDQTALEIKTAYESNSDTNAFTDAEETKLAGIEANATQDQSAAEIKTAYESNADTNAFTDTEKTKLAGIETGATADQTDAEIKTAYENNSNTNAFTDAEQTKLGGIETGAQVNVATNLSYSSGTRVVSSSTGADATLPLAVASGDAGLLTGADKTQLDNLSTNLAGKANLSGGKLALSEVPDLAITEFLGTVANQTAMLAKTGQQGDWVVRSDEGKVYIITGSDPSLISNWTALSYPASDVLSVNGLTGTVVLDADDISDASTSKKFTTASDISKLAGIEAGATADQTDSEIKTAYENNANTNAFTDANETKLAGIETNATADQTAAEIKTAYESNSDTNEFSDAEKTKLAGIAAGAEVNVATNLAYDSSTRTVSSSTGTNATISEVVASGDSGLITGADKAKLDGVEAGATADQSAAEIKTAYESNSDTNVFDDAAVAKLSGVEANATTDQTAAEILTAVKTVDGTGSGLDADLLDGQEGSHYLNYSNFVNTPTIPTNNNQLTNGAGYITSTLTNEQVQDIAGGMVTGNTETGISVTYQDSDGTIDFVVASQTDENFTTTLRDKLNGIESAATRDQSDGEIKAAYLSNSDTNNFDDAAQTKLAGIAAGAQVNVATDLAYDSSTRTVSSSTGTNAAISEVVASGDSGLITGADKAKLDGIESGATADQTAAQIKSEYLSNSDTNNFDDAAQTKLSGIAAGAEVNVNADWNSSTGDSQILNKPTIPAAYTDSSVDSHLNVSSASNNEVLSWTGSDYDWVAQSGGGGAVDSVNTQTGAVVLDADDISDSSTTNKYTTAGDISKLAGIEAGATADQTAAEIKTAYESNSDTNAFTDAEESKLSGIAAGAEVNVNADWNSSSGDSQILNKPTIPAAYTDASVDTHLNTSSASSNEVLSWTGTDYDWVAQSGGGGSSSLATAVYEGPSTAQSITSQTYSVVNIATGVGTPNAIFSNSSGEVTLGAIGTYLVMCTVVLTGTTTNYRWTGELNIEQDITDGNGFSEIGSVRGGYIRVNNGSNNTYVSISRIVTTANSTNKIQFQIKRTSDSAGDGTIVADNSTIQVIKLDGAVGPAGPSDIPQNSQTGAYTLVAGDNGKHISISTGGVTVPSGVFSVGNVVTIYNNGSSDQTITQGSSVTLRLAGTTTTSNRTLAEHGLCTILCVASNTFVISGAGLT